MENFLSLHKDVIQNIANFATFLAFIIAALQLRANNMESKKLRIQTRSEYIIRLYNDYINNEDMFEIYYQLEYGLFTYNPQQFHGSTTEKKLDKLLGHFSNIGRLFYQGIITEEDLEFFEYEFIIIYENEQIKSYLTWLDNWFERREINNLKYEHFRKTGEYLSNKNKI